VSIAYVANKVSKLHEGLSQLDLGVIVISVAVVRFGPVQEQLSKNQGPNHGPVQRNCRTQNWTNKNGSEWSCSVLRRFEPEPDQS